MRQTCWLGGLLVLMWAGCTEQLDRVVVDSRVDLPPSSADLPLSSADHQAARDRSGEAPVPRDARGDLPDGQQPADAQTTSDRGDPADLETTSDSGGPCPAPGLTPGTHNLSIQHGGLDRTFLLYVPQGYTNQVHLPLVLDFHGLGSNASQQAQNSKLNSKADQEGFLVVHPQGYQNSWNAGVCCGQASSTQVDDVGFTRAMVADLEQRICLDRRRIFSTGMSNGGLMSYRLACEAADLVAAIGPVAGMLVLSSCTPSRPVPIIHFHGTEDSLVNYASASSTVAGWVTRDGCTDAQPTETYSQGAARCETYQQCTAGVEVVFCTVTGGGHCWPGNSICFFGASTTDISATDAMWDFFDRFTLP